MATRVAFCHDFRQSILYEVCPDYRCLIAISVPKDRYISQTREHSYLYQVNEMSDILFDVRDEVGVLTFNRPSSRNALTLAMYEKLAEIAQSIIDNSTPIRVLIITGAGDKAFAAGTDINSFDTLNSPDDAIEYERLMDRVLSTLEQVPVPTIAAIRGACTGGGAAIALCCDLRIADRHLRFGFPIAKTLGNCLSTRNLARIVESLGANLTREILLTARLLSIEEACDVKLINQCHHDPLAQAQLQAEQFKLLAPLTISATKEGLRRLREQWSAVDDDDLIVQCYTSDDFRF